MKSAEVKREFKEFERWAIESDMPARSYLARARIFMEIINDLEKSEEVSNS